MRDRLRKYDKKRIRIIATFVRYGKRSGWEGRELTTILLRNIIHKDTQELLAGYIWLTYGKNFERIGPLQEGDIIALSIRVTQYKKTRDNKLDYRFAYPTVVEMVKRVSLSSPK